MRVLHCQRTSWSSMQCYLACSDTLACCRDPDGAMLAFADMMKKQIVMPAHMMNDNVHLGRTGRNIFQDFSTVAEMTGTYTAHVSYNTLRVCKCSPILLLSVHAGAADRPQFQHKLWRTVCNAPALRDVQVAACCLLSHATDLGFPQCLSPLKLCTKHTLDRSYISGVFQISSIPGQKLTALQSIPDQHVA